MWGRSKGASLRTRTRRLGSVSMSRIGFSNGLDRTFARLNTWIGTALILITAFVTADAAGLPLDQGPGGPILIVTSSTNPFSKYYAEILRAEGLNSFSVIDASLLSPATLSAYDVVLLGQAPLTDPQASMLSNYVNSGGNLIAMRPDIKLAGLLGLSATTSTLSDQYLLIDNST